MAFLDGVVSVFENTLSMLLRTIRYMINTICERDGLNNEQLASAIGVNTRTIASWRCMEAFPNPEHLSMIISIFSRKVIVHKAGPYVTLQDMREKKQN